MNNLQHLIQNNPQIDNKESVLELLSWLETMIPTNCRENLYRNIATATIILDETEDLEEETSIDGSIVTGGYNIQENKLRFVTKAIEKIWEEAQTKPNPEEAFGNEIARLTLHELVHLASSYYDKETGKSYCGFNVYPADDESQMNMGLTEGMTEYITSVGVPDADDTKSSYYIETLFVVQLTFLVGGLTMLSSFFANKGISPLEEKLNQIISDPNMSFQLFRNIENNYEVDELDEVQSFMGDVQKTLIEYLIVKVTKEKEKEDFDSRATLKMLTDYETMLVTDDVLRQMGKIPNNYLGIKESVQKFKEFKKSFEAEYDWNTGKPISKGPSM